MVSHRQKRVADLIQEELADLLQREAQDPRFDQVSITGVEVSPDLKNAKIYFSILSSEEGPSLAKPEKQGASETVREVMQAFEKASGYLRTALASRIELRYMPKLLFRFDNSLNQGERIERLLRQIAEEGHSEEETDR